MEALGFPGPHAVSVETVSARWVPGDTAAATRLLCAAVGDELSQMSSPSPHCPASGNVATRLSRNGNWHLSRF